jgi:hypothetical protein
LVDGHGRFCILIDDLAATCFSRGKYRISRNEPDAFQNPVELYEGRWLLKLMSECV